MYLKLYICLYINESDLLLGHMIQNLPESFGLN